ncbi:MAG: tetratricopeptide repeat protein [Desulfosoma sp.]
MWEGEEAKRVNEDLLKRWIDIRRWDEAEALLRKSSAEAPYDTAILARLGSVLWEAGKRREALEALEKALMLDQDDVQVIEALLKVFVAVGRQKDAEDILSAYMERNPWDLEAKDRLSRFLTQHVSFSSVVTSPVGQPQRSDREESESQVLVRVGEEEFLRQKFDRAKVCFELAYEKDPGNAKALNNLGVVAWQQGNTTAALEYFQKALDVDPLDGEILLNSARALGDLSQWETAADLLQIYLSRHGNDEEAWSDYRRFVQALATSWNGDGLSEKVAHVYVEMGRKLADLGDYQGAIGAYGRALKISSHLADAYYGLGLLEQNLNRHEEAMEMFRAALEVDPSHKQAAEALQTICQKDDEPISNGSASLEDLAVFQGSAL